MSESRSGEDVLIELIRRTTRRRGRVRVGIGDDACVLRNGTVVTTDAYVEGVHFDLGYMSLRDVGRRCTCGAVSDVVAMAAEPEAVLVSLVLPRDEARSIVRATRYVWRLYQGIEDVCTQMGCEVAGGDIVVSDRLALALTATGRASRPKLRSGARPGDWLYVTGTLGSAEAGRLVLRQSSAGFRRQKAECRTDGGERKGERIPRWARAIVQRHLCPLPRLDVVRALSGRIHGLIDTSDGLATDARHLAEMSGVRAVIDAPALPVDSGARRLCKERGLDLTEFVFGAGEDYELLFTSSRRLPSGVRGVAVTRIGWIEAGKGLFVDSGAHVSPVTARGYDHLRL